MYQTWQWPATATTEAVTSAPSVIANTESNTPIAGSWPAATPYVPYGTQQWYFPSNGVYPGTWPATSATMPPTGAPVIAASKEGSSSSKIEQNSSSLDEEDKLNQLRAQAQQWQQQQQAMGWAYPTFSPAATGCTMQWPQGTYGQGQWPVAQWTQQWPQTQPSNWIQPGKVDEAQPKNPQLAISDVKVLDESNNVTSQIILTAEQEKEEQEFDKQFQEWEKQFEAWKEENAGHPDKEAFAVYEKQWQEWRDQLLGKKEEMKKKRLSASESKPQGSIDDKSVGNSQKSSSDELHKSAIPGLNINPSVANSTVMAGMPYQAQMSPALQLAPQAHMMLPGMQMPPQHQSYAVQQQLPPHSMQQQPPHAMPKQHPSMQHQMLGSMQQHHPPPQGMPMRPPHAMHQQRVPSQQYPQMNAPPNLEPPRKTLLSNPRPPGGLLPLPPQSSTFGGKPGDTNQMECPENEFQRDHNIDEFDNCGPYEMQMEKELYENEWEFHQAGRGQEIPDYEMEHRGRGQEMLEFEVAQRGRGHAKRSRGRGRGWSERPAFQESHLDIRSSNFEKPRPNMHGSKEFPRRFGDMPRNMREEPLFEDDSCMLSTKFPPDTGPLSSNYSPDIGPPSSNFHPDRDSPSVNFTSNPDMPKRERFCKQKSFEDRFDEDQFDNGFHSFEEKQNPQHPMVKEALPPHPIEKDLQPHTNQFGRGAKGFGNRGQDHCFGDPHEKHFDFPNERYPLDQGDFGPYERHRNVPVMDVYHEFDDRIQHEKMLIMRERHGFGPDGFLPDDRFRFMDDQYPPPYFDDQDSYRNPKFPWPEFDEPHPSRFMSTLNFNSIDYTHQPASVIIGKEFCDKYDAFGQDFSSSLINYRDNSYSGLIPPLPAPLVFSQVDVQSFDYSHGEKPMVSSTVKGKNDSQDNKLEFSKKAVFDYAHRREISPTKDRNMGDDDIANRYHEHDRDKFRDQERLGDRDRDRSDFDKNRNRENDKARDRDRNRMLERDGRDYNRDRIKERYRDNKRDLARDRVKTKDREDEERNKRFRWDNSKDNKNLMKERSPDDSPQQKFIEKRKDEPVEVSSFASNVELFHSDVSSETALIKDLLYLPGRCSRPKQLVIILRGLPGSGKTYVAKLIKDKEVENGGSAPRILALDDYFMIEKEVTDIDPETGKKVKRKEFEYEYEACMEEAYRSSLFKSFKKTVDDRFFPFIIVDAVHEEIKQIEQFWSYAKQRGFQVYVAEMDCTDPAICHKRNVHNRTLEEIIQLEKKWEPKPRHFLALDIRSLLQDVAITEVEMEDTNTENDTEKANEDAEEDEDEDENNDDPSHPHEPSRWEKLDTEDKLDKLDGLRVAKKKHSTMEDYLQLPDDYEQRKCEPGKKRVRWADLEERKEQDRLRAIGFVVGQTDWAKFTDPSHADKALTKTKYF